MAKDTFVTIAIPTHCSSLSRISERIEHFRAACIARSDAVVKSDDDGSCHAKLHHATANKRRRREEHQSVKSRSRNPSVGIIAIQCRLDRIVWNEFLPMVFDIYFRRLTSDVPLYKAVLILLRHFKRYVCSIDEESTTDIDIGTSYNDDVGDADATERDGIDGHNTGTRAFYEQKIHILPSSKDTRKKKKITSHVLLLILPPYPPHSSVAPSLGPERIFTPRLVRLENILVRLQSLNAFFSTLGGGYFLCRYLTTAVRLARTQRAVALSMGDQNLAGRCTVNEAYNYIHAGKIKHALMLLKQVKAAAVARGDDLTVSMCKSARIFAKRVRKANAYEGTKQGVDDELQRIRIVKDDSKINRTFRPLHEL